VPNLTCYRLVTWHFLHVTIKSKTRGGNVPNLTCYRLVTWHFLHVTNTKIITNLLYFYTLPFSDVADSNEQ
jgi:hypothetical protein